MSNLKKRTRNDDEIFLIGHDSMQICGAKLPSNKQVLQVLFYCTRQLNFSIEQSAQIVIDEVLVFWSKARINTSSASYCRKKLLNLHQKWRDLQKNKGNTSIGATNSLKQFKDSLDDLFDVAHSEALLSTDEKAKAFLVSQRQKGRIGCLTGADEKERLKQEKEQMERENKQLVRKMQEEKRKAKWEAESVKQCNFS